jgi:hypothetical protein
MEFEFKLIKIKNSSSLEIFLGLSTYMWEVVIAMTIAKKITAGSLQRILLVRSGLTALITWKDTILFN